MDVFEPGRARPRPAPARPPTPEVSFDAGTEFNLSFFDPPERAARSSSPPAPCAAALTPKREQQYVADSANPLPGSKTFVPCKVCGDKASGYHYGVTSCEGCKGFFRRSIQKQIEYRCLRDGKCLVIRLNRNRCQFCRFKKCLAVGMSRDSVRYGRVPKRSREKGMEEALNEAGPVAVAGAANVVEDSSDIVTAVASAHRAYCAFTEELTRGLQRRPLPPPSPPNPSPSPPVDPSSPTASALTPVDSQRVWLWQQLAVRVTPSVQRVVEFAKRVPGFPDLSQDDQLILIKMGFFEIWLCHAARFATESMLTFDDGVYVTHNQLEVMYDVQFAASVLGFMTNLNITCLNETEIGLFAAAVLVTPDRPGVTDVKAVQFHQERIVEALKFQISRRHSGAEGLSVEALLGELRAVGTHHLHLLDWFRANWTSLRLPPLFAEIFDIPKCDEDLQ